MSLFDNISFMNEGEQAEEYKIRKSLKDKSKENDKYHAQHRAGWIRTEYEMKGHGKNRRAEEANPERIVKKNTRRDLSNGTTLTNMKSGNTNSDVKNVKEREITFYNLLNPNGKKEIEPAHIERSPSKDDKLRDKYATKVAKRQDYSGLDKEEKELSIEKNRDCINRNMRRHPENWKKSKWIGNESGIFESIQFINE